MKKLTFLFALCGLVYSFAGMRQAQAEDQNSCAQLVQNLNDETNEDRLAGCIDFYWHNGEYDSPPGSFNNIIAISRRWVEVNPYELEVYTDGAWLLWSKWDTWFHNHDQMPDGEGKAQAAIDFLQQGMRWNGKNPDYLKDCGDTIFPLAKGYMPQYFAFVIDSYQKADLYSDDKALKIRVRLNIGHAYRFQNKKPEAIAAFETVLDLDPTNAVAIRLIKELKGG